MDIQTAKQIRIADYLHSLGYSPVKQQGVNLWYKSPLREEAEASFKVNTEREQWYDFGHRTGCTPVCYRPCTLHLETDSRADTARAPGIFLFWKAKLFRAELPTVGDCSAVIYCPACLLTR